MQRLTVSAQPALAALTLVIGLVLSAAAAARGPLADSNPIAEAVKRAVEYWGGTPCRGHVAVVSGGDSEAPAAGANAPGARGRNAAMWASWATPIGVDQLSRSPATFSACVVHVNRSVWPSRQAEDRNFAAFCKEMLHEYGHFEGFPDAGAVRNTIQYERPDLAHVPICEHYRLVYRGRIYAGSPIQRSAGRRASAGPPAGSRPTKRSLSS
jgi:hypothetical protein